MLLAIGKPLTLDQIAEKMSWSKDRCRLILRDLERNGLIEITEARDEIAYKSA